MSFLNILRPKPQPTISIDLAKSLIDLAFRVGELGADAKAFARSCAAMNTTARGCR